MKPQLRGTRLLAASLLLLVSVTGFLAAGNPTTVPSPEKDQPAKLHASQFGNRQGENPPKKSNSVVEAVPLLLTVASKSATNSDGVSASASLSVPTGAQASRASLQPKNFSEQLSGNLLRYERVQVSGNYRLRAKQILAQAGLSGSQGGSQGGSPWVWELSPERIATRLRELPWIEAVQFRITHYPLQLEVQVKEAEPWFIAEYEKHSWLVSRSGNLIQPLDALHGAEIILETTELPRLDGLDAHPDMATYLASANARFLYAVKSIKLLQAAGNAPFPVERYTLLPAGGLQLTPEHDSCLPSVLIAVESFEQAEQSLSRLRIILDDLQKRDEQVKRIDLRFHNQAVVE